MLNMALEDGQPVALTSTKDASPFLKLPAEIRNQIYGYLVGPPDMTVPFEKMRMKCKILDSLWIRSSRPRVCFFKPQVERVVTPTVLLLNHQINTEAMSLLRSRPFVLTSPPPHCGQLGRVLDITEFIGEATLQKFTHVVLEMDLRIHSWLKTIETLLELWLQANSLQLLHVRVKCRKQTGRIIEDNSRRESTSNILTLVRFIMFPFSG